MNAKDYIPYVKPSITELEITAVERAIRHGWGKHCYDDIKAFEAEFADFLGVQFAVATSSCTGALQLGMHALGIGPGDEVILADTNWIASVAPIVHLGATPVFVDILHDSWCIDPDLVEAAISSKTKAILAVHLYGNLCDLERLRGIAERYNLHLIEDAAEALGSVYHGKRAGAVGSFGAFSFHGTKTITTGEGGMFVTSDPELHDAVCTLANHGRDRKQSKQFWADRIGYKFKMSNTDAALGRAQLSRIEELVEKKRYILSRYKGAVAGIPEITMNPEHAGTENGAWMPTAVFDPSLKIDRDTILDRFKRENIDARVFFHPLSSLPMFAEQPQNTNAYSIANRAINLPSFHEITDEQIDRVVGILISLLD